MSNRISPEHMAEIKAMTRGVLPSQLLGHIAALEEENERLHDLACADWFRCPVPQLNEANDALKEENERLRDVAGRLTKALNDCIEIFVVFDTDTERVIAIEHTVNAALAALDEEVGSE